MIANPISVRATTHSPVRFGNTTPEQPAAASATSAADTPERPPLAYTRAGFERQFDAYFQHLSQMTLEQRQQAAGWLVRQNAHLMKDRSGEALKALSNRDFVKYLAIAHFFRRAEQRSLLEDTLRQTMGPIRRFFYRRRLESLGLKVGRSHEYRKQNQQLRQSNPLHRELPWDEFLAGRLPQTQPIRFPFRFGV